MGNKRVSTYVPDGKLEQFGVGEAGWYVADENRRLVDGPYSTRTECEKAIAEAEAQQ
jgi:hypothetical protein